MEWNIGAVEVEGQQEEEKGDWEAAGSRKSKRKGRMWHKMEMNAEQRSQVDSMVGEWEKRIDLANESRKWWEWQDVRRDSRKTSTKGRSDSETKWEDAVKVEVDQKFIGVVGKLEQTTGMTFQVAGVRKALAAVWSTCKAGNLVQFGDMPEECFVQNKGTGKKVMLEKRGESYILKVLFVKRKMEVTIGRL